MSKLKVLVIGAGLGGLCLAQALRRAQIDVQVFEKDASPWDRPQGYRLHLDADGINALREVLPSNLYSLFIATSMEPLDSTTIIDTGLQVLKRIPNNVHGGNKIDDAPKATGPLHVNVNRATLRQIALSGLEEVCHFSASLERYESDATGVTAHFSDGTTARGDILVGADGIRSTVRKQRAPEAQVMDSSIRAIYGRIPIQDARLVVPQQALEDVFTVAADVRKVFLGLGPMIFPVAPDVASMRLAPEAKLPKQQDYVVSIVGGRSEHFGTSDEDLRRASSRELQTLATKMLEQWPTHASAIPAHGDPNSFFFIEMYSSVPCTLSAATNVTLLGDAIHAMTPTLGRGANVAMRDGVLLSRQIIAVEQGKSELVEALSSYESEMTSYGFEVVRESVKMGQRLIGQDALPA